MSNKIVNNDIQPRLQYNYAKIILSTGECTSCGTSSYQINNPAYIEVPYATDDYLGKFYNTSSQKWYLDPSFETEWLEAPQW